MRLSDRKDILKTRKILLISSISLIAVVGALLVFILRSRPPTYYQEEAFLMGTRIRVVVASKKFSAKNLAESVINEFRRIDAKFDPYREGSDLYKLNHSDGWVEVDEEVYSVVESAIKYCKATSGAFDPTLGKLIVLWGFNEFSERKEFRVPTDEEILRALKSSGCDKVEFDPKKMGINLHGVWLDLGGMIKGYALERAAAIVKSLDPNATGFIDAGGEIKIIGPKYGNAPWVIGIRDPRGSGAIDYVYLRSGAIATSGDYERYFVVDGIRYHHILDPKTGKPARGVRSITVIADDAVVADVYSTAGFVMGKDWRYVITRFPELGMQVFTVLDDGRIVKSRGFEYYEERR